MEFDSQLMIILLAVKLNGGTPSPKLDVFKKLKTYLADAKKRELVKEDTIEVSILVKGKSKQKKETVLALTELGKEYIETHGGETARVVAIASQSAASASQIRDLKQHLQADRETLRTEVLAIANTEPKGANPTKDLVAIGKKVADIAKALETLEAKLKPTDEGKILARLDDAFAKLDQRLHARLDTTNGSQPVKITPAIDSANHLRDVLREAYETLCLYIEFDSGVVELPRLYHEARKTMPGLTVHTFHQQLELLSAQRVLELKVLNEVRAAKEPDKAIRRGDNLYYFIYWPQK